MASKHAELIRRIDAAPEGSRELDAEIDVAIGRGRSVDPFSLGRIPHYTTSLDAALTLVPEGHQLKSLTTGGLDYGEDDAVVSLWRATLHPKKRANGHVYGHNKHKPALALCAASLRAMGEKDG